MLLLVVNCDESYTWPSEQILFINSNEWKVHKHDWRFCQKEALSTLFHNHVSHVVAWPVMIVLGGWNSGSCYICFMTRVTLIDHGPRQQFSNWKIFNFCIVTRIYLHLLFFLYFIASNILLFQMFGISLLVIMTTCLLQCLVIITGNGPLFFSLFFGDSLLVIYIHGL